MLDKKLLAKKSALEGMSKSLKEDSRSFLKPDLEEKKKIKMTISAPDEKSMVKALSKAEEILKAKFGDMGLDEEVMEELDGEEEVDCEACSNHGCPMCYEEPTEELEMEEASDMSDEMEVE